MNFKQMIDITITKLKIETSDNLNWVEETYVFCSYEGLRYLKDNCIFCDMHKNKEDDSISPPNCHFCGVKEICQKIYNIDDDKTLEYLQMIKEHYPFIAEDIEKKVEEKG